MASTTNALSKHLQKIAASWPADPLRPNLQLRTFLGSLVFHPNLTPRAVEATQTLRSNGVAKKYPLSDKMLKPASMPHHYDRLIEAFEKSVQGIGRPWWKVFFGIW